MKRLLLDVLLTGTLAASLGVLQNWIKWRMPARDFVALYNPLIWAILCGVFFALVSIFIWKVFGYPQRVLFRIFEIIAILATAEALASFFYILQNPREDVMTDMGLGLWFLLIPSVAASVGIFLLLVALRRLISVPSH